MQLIIFLIIFQIPDWPKNLSDFEKKNGFLIKQRQVNLGLLLVDNGKIGFNYFVVMGIKKELLFKNKVTFNKLKEIIKSMKIMYIVLLNFLYSFINFSFMDARQTY